MIGSDTVPLAGETASFVTLRRDDDGDAFRCGSRYARRRDRQRGRDEVRRLTLDAIYGNDENED